MYQATNIFALERIHSSLEEIQAYAEGKYNADNPSAVVDRMNCLESYIALSSKLVADSNYHYDKVLNSAFIAAIKEAEKARLSPSTLNKYLETLMYDYKYLTVWAERINRACTHQLDSARSILSKLKEELKAAQWSAQA